MADMNGSDPLQKKSVGVRPWLLINSTGRSQILEAGKHAIMRRTGLPGRDLRRLDPVLPYPCSILGRERAIIFNVEHVKAIIMAHEVMLLNHKDPAVAPFVEGLRGKILQHHDTVDDPSDHGEVMEAENLDDGQKLIPFEFVVLEACLEAACTCLDSEAIALEEEAYPALDQLTSYISTLNLERVHQIKSRLIDITKRVEKVRDELERLLDDDEAMSKMYLLEKHHQHLENSDADEDGTKYMKNTGTILSGEGFRTPAEILTEISGGSTKYGTDLLGSSVDHQEEESIFEGNNSEFGRFSQATYASTTKLSTRSKNLDVKDLEMFLEASFVQIDATLNGLSTLREYVDDTEDYINIMLDDKMNNLMEMVIRIMTASIALTCFMIVDSVLAININIALFNHNDPPNKSFLWMICAGISGIICIYVMINCLYRYKGLLP